MKEKPQKLSAREFFQTASSDCLKCGNLGEKSCPFTRAGIESGIIDAEDAKQEIRRLQAGTNLNNCENS